MKRIAMALLGSLLITALLSASTEAIAAPACRSAYKSNEPAPRELHDFDVQFTMTSNAALDLLLASSVHETILYKQSTLQKISKLPDLMSDVHPKILPQLNAVAAFTGMGELILLDLKTQNLNRWKVLDLSWNKFSSFDLSSDGRFLVVEIDSGYQIFDTRTRQKIASGRGQVVAAPKFSKDGKEVALLIDHKLTVLEVQTGKILRQTETDIFELPGAIYSSDARLLGGRQFNPNFSSIIDVATGAKIGQVEGRISSFSSDGQYVGVNYGTRTRIYDVKTQTLLVELKHSNRHWSSHFSEDGKRFYVSTENGALLTYDFASVLSLAQ